MTKEEIQSNFQSIQDQITRGIESADGKAHFSEDNWNRAEGGGGRTRTIAHGNVIEKGGVAFSAVHGPTPEKILHALKLKDADFFATGVSLVMHPQNPYVPIIHMNVRYFEMSNGIWWFGGGIDLTPHYVDQAQAQWFHQQLKATCDHHDSNYYPEFKKWADDYFYLKHRNETRGVGGIFFDRLNETKNKSKQEIWSFVEELALSFVGIYTHLIKLNKDKPYGERELLWQRLRRGRYVEFNLVWDKGTKFGLDTNGRTESILLSMPPQANWEYQHQVAKGSAEYDTLQLLKKEVDWINLIS
ncbi:MAG: oxygen-dependent coproporphyrinogen oxidase [Cyclobacteriaceae bacterium]|nr:oxygen-dependent coproporphyrinogen oxidase [Cyclobacteriaceae bacterium]MCH8516069.1 oxygen-dependent coproporphyrinogen oxidase [Cyclobacteriaceae bacterium]